MILNDENINILFKLTATKTVHGT